MIALSATRLRLAGVPVGLCLGLGAAWALGWLSQPYPPSAEHRGLGLRADHAGPNSVSEESAAAVAAEVGPVPPPAYERAALSADDASQQSYDSWYIPAAEGERDPTEAVTDRARLMAQMGFVPDLASGPMYAGPNEPAGESGWYAYVPHADATVLRYGAASVAPYKRQTEAQRSTDPAKECLDPAPHYAYPTGAQRLAEGES